MSIVSPKKKTLLAISLPFIIINILIVCCITKPVHRGHVVQRYSSVKLIVSHKILQANLRRFEPHSGWTGIVIVGQIEYPGKPLIKELLDCLQKVKENRNCKQVKTF